MDDLRAPITGATGGEDPIAPLYENEVGLPGGISVPGRRLTSPCPTWDRAATPSWSSPR